MMMVQEIEVWIMVKVVEMEWSQLGWLVVCSENEVENGLEWVQYVLQHVLQYVYCYDYYEKNVLISNFEIEAWLIPL